MKRRNSRQLKLRYASHNTSSSSEDERHHNHPPKPKNSIHIDVAHHNTHVEVAHHNTHVEVAHHNHIDVNHNNTHINIHIVVAHPNVRIHLAVRLIANANLQDLPLSHLLDQAHIRAHHNIAHLDPPPDPHLEEDPQHEVILLFIDY